MKLFLCNHQEYGSTYVIANNYQSAVETWRKYLILDDSTECPDNITYLGTDIAIPEGICTMPIELKDN